MAEVQSARAWEKAQELALEIQRLSQTLPAAEKHGLAEQLRRAAGDSALNLAECQAPGTDYARAAGKAGAAAGEVLYYLMQARDRGYLTEPESAAGRDLATEVLRLANGLRAERQS
jgi:four helix bundle protein